MLSCYLFAMENFNSSVAEIDDMDLNLLLDLISVHGKLTERVDRKKRQVYIDEIL